ncbi:hypothetical protein [Paracoccus sp. (in: a-proteobacteria)]|uniref:hypothetical protein n=1 Tax=Paracoccus sp. TaxID=267 RepID=UPI0033407A83
MTMAQISQLSLIAFTIGLSGFCFVLARRLRKLNDLETGLGGAIAVMTSEIGRLEKSILFAKSEAISATQSLSKEIERAKQERAFWMLQQKFAETGLPRPTRVQRKRRREEAVADA